MAPKKSDRQLIDEGFAVLVEHFKHGKEECYESAECECEEGEAVNLAGEALARLTREADSLREQVRTLTAERDGVIDLLRAARETLKAQASELPEHVYHEFACHLEDEPNRPDGARITTQADALRARVDVLTEQMNEAMRRERHAANRVAEFVDAVGERGRIGDDALTVLRRELEESDALRARVAELEAENERDSAQQRAKALEEAVRDLREVAFDGPSEPKGAPGGESVYDWRNRIDRETKALLSKETKP